MKATECLLDEPLGDLPVAKPIRSATLGICAAEPCDGHTARPIGKSSLQAALGTRRVLVPTDFSPSSSEAIRCAYRLAAELKGELLVLYVELPINHHDASVNEKEAQRRARHLLRRAEKMLARQIRETIGVGGTTPLHSLITEGFAYDSIVKEAGKHGAEYIVIARHGHTDDRSVLIGPTAESVLRHATCPVVLVNA